MLKFFVTSIWFSKEYALSDVAVFLIILETCLRGMHYPVYMVRSAFGLFSQLRIIAVIGAAINILLDLIVGKPFGVAGIFLATIVSRSFVAIVDVFVIYHYGFSTGVSRFMTLWIKAVGYTTILAALCYGLNRLLIIDNYFLKFVASVLMIGLIYTIGAMIFFRKDEEYVYFKSIFLKMLYRLWNRQGN